MRSRIESIDPKTVERVNAALIDSRRSGRFVPLSWDEVGRRQVVKSRRQNTVAPGTEVLTMSLYDTFTIAADTAVTQQVLFQTANRVANLSNMQQAGVLPNPNMMDIRQILVVLRNDAVLADALNLGFNCTLDLQVSGKSRLKLPLYRFTAGCGLVVQGGDASVDTIAAGMVSSVNNGVPDPRAVYALSQPIIITGGEGFRLLITPDTGWSTQNAGKPVGTGITVAVHLHGELYGPVA